MKFTICLNIIKMVLFHGWFYWEMVFIWVSNGRTLQRIVIKYIESTFGDF